MGCAHKSVKLYSVAIAAAPVRVPSPKLKSVKILKVYLVDGGIKPKFLIVFIQDQMLVFESMLTNITGFDHFKACSCSALEL